jgi:hypothetical protein
MLIDLHVHTSRYSSCGNATPEEMAAAALAHGLDGIVITEHNVMWPVAELDALREAFPALLILNGIELTSDRGDDYLVIGLDHQDWFAPRLPAGELTCRAQARGGVVILAHPYRYRDELPDTLDAFPVDGVEVASCNMHGAASVGAAQLAVELDAFQVWNSDAHDTDTVGLYANRLPRLIATVAELAASLTRGLHRAHADTQRVTAFNDSLYGYLPVIERMIADGADDQTIRAALPILVRFSDLYAIRSGLEVWRPLPIDEPEAMPGSE